MKRCARTWAVIPSVLSLCSAMTSEAKWKAHSNQLAAFGEVVRIVSLSSPGRFERQLRSEYPGMTLKVAFETDTKDECEEGLPILEV